MTVDDGIIRWGGKDDTHVKTINDGDVESSWQHGRYKKERKRKREKCRDIEPIPHFKWEGKKQTETLSPFHLSIYLFIYLSIFWPINNNKISLWYYIMLVQFVCGSVLMLVVRWIRFVLFYFGDSFSTSTPVVSSSWWMMTNWGLKVHRDVIFLAPCQCRKMKNKKNKKFGRRTLVIGRIARSGLLRIGRKCWFIGLCCSGKWFRTSSFVCNLDDSSSWRHL